MESQMELIRPVVKAAAKANVPEDGDYTDSEGLLVCGRCGTRRQIRMVVQSRNGPVEMVVPALCECRDEERKREEADRKRKEDMEVVKSMRRQSLMDERLLGATFDSFQVTADNARVLRLCKRYAEGFDEMLEKNQGLLFHGETGTGKTFAAACIANYLLARKVSVVMTSFVKLLSMQNQDDEQLIARMNRAKLLIVDDLGAERSTDYALERVYNIVDSRYRSRRPVIFTTNLSMVDMKGNTDVRFSRIYDRIFELCYPVTFAGKSWRKADAAKRYDEMKAFLEE